MTAVMINHLCRLKSRRRVGCIVGLTILSWSPLAQSGTAPRQTYSNHVDASPLDGSIEERGFRVEEAAGFVRREFTVVTVTLSRRNARLELRYERDAGVSIAEAADRLQKEGARNFVLLNGGFLRSFSPITPANFLKVRDQIENPATDIKDDPLASGVLCISARNDISIELSPSGGAFPSAFTGQRDCIQAGPLLMKDGSPQDLSDLGATPRTGRFVGEDFSRSFVAVKQSGDFVVGFSTPTSLGSLADVISDSLGQGAGASALNLQGSTNSALVAYSGGRAVYARGNLAAAQSTYFVVLPTQR